MAEQNEMDDADRVWLKEFKGIPDNALIQGFVAIIAWIDPECGEDRFKVYNTMDTSLATTIGHMEVAKSILLDGGYKLTDDPSDD